MKATLEISLVRILGYVERFSGDANLNKFLSMVQRTILLVRSLQIALRALEMASGPIGWLYAGTSVVAAGMSGYSMLESMTGA